MEMCSNWIGNWVPVLSFNHVLCRQKKKERRKNQRGKESSANHHYHQTSNQRKRRDCLRKPRQSNVNYKDRVFLWPSTLLRLAKNRPRKNRKPRLQLHRWKGRTQVMPRIEQEMDPESSDLKRFLRWEIELLSVAFFARYLIGLLRTLVLKGKSNGNHCLIKEGFGDGSPEREIIWISHPKESPQIIFVDQNDLQRLCNDFDWCWWLWKDPYFMVFTFRISKILFFWGRTWYLFLKDFA